MERPKFKWSAIDAVAFLGLAVLGVVGVSVGLAYLLAEGVKKGWQDDEDSEGGKKAAGADPAVKVKGRHSVAKPGAEPEPAGEPAGEPDADDGVPSGEPGEGELSK